MTQEEFFTGIKAVERLGELQLQKYDADLQAQKAWNSAKLEESEKSLNSESDEQTKKLILEAESRLQRALQEAERFKHDDFLYEQFIKSAKKLYSIEVDLAKIK